MLAVMLASRLCQDLSKDAAGAGWVVVAVSGGSNSNVLVSPSTPTRSKMVGASTPSVVVADVASSITGDLARKMTFRALYRLERRGLLDCPIIGVGHEELSIDQLLQRARVAISGAGERLDGTVFDCLVGRLSYLDGDVTEDALYGRLAEQVGGHDRPLFYLEMPMSLFAPIVEHLAAAGLLEHARVAVEKPFGHDLASARDLDARLHRVLREGADPAGRSLPGQGAGHRTGVPPVRQPGPGRGLGPPERVVHPDHHGRELRSAGPGQVLRLRRCVARCGSESLAASPGPGRDGAPAGASAEELRDKKVEVFKAIPAANPAHYVRGQYADYTDVPGVAPHSSTETFVALRLEIDNWRWAGVPIFLRAGKALPERVTEVRLLLHRTPRLAFLPTPTQVGANQIVLRIDPDPGLRLQIAARSEDSWRPVHLDTSFSQELGEPREPYERLLHAALVGDPQLFARQDSVEQTWRILQPLLDNPPSVHTYPRGSWGPDEASSLLHEHPRWQQPWLDQHT